MKRSLLFTLVALSTLAFAGGAIQAAQNKHKLKPSPPAVAPADPEPSAKTVGYGRKDVVKVNTKVKFTTLIILPDSERILEFSCGDKEFWVVNGNDNNIAFVKPAKEGSMTNLNLITASGNIYTFVLIEVSQQPNTQPDLKVFVEPREESMIIAASKAPRFASPDEIAEYIREIDNEKDEIKRVQQTAQEALDGQIGKFLSETKFTYHFDPEKRPFHVQAIYHDSHSTFIKAAPEEVPTLYEIRDGRPNLVNFEYKNGVYIAEKVIDRGYLAIGKSRLLFVRKEAQ